MVVLVPLFQERRAAVLVRGERAAVTADYVAGTLQMGVPACV